MLSHHTVYYNLTYVYRYLDISSLLIVPFKVPTLPILKTIVGPGPCLLKALPAKTSADTLNNMVDANEFECKAWVTVNMKTREV